MYLLLFIEASNRLLGEYSIGSVYFICEILFNDNASTLILSKFSNESNLEGELNIFDALFIVSDNLSVTDCN